MKLVLMLVMLMSSCLVAMEEKAFTSNKAIGHKLKLVCTAGPYVYDEHIEIYTDVCCRMQRLSQLCTDNNVPALEAELKRYIDMLGRAQGIYKNTTAVQDPLIPLLFEEAQKSCLTWLFAFPRVDKIVPESMKELKKSFGLKCSKTKSSLEAARYRQDQFAKGNDLSHRLPVTAAVTAWCVTLPKPTFMIKPRSHSFSFEIPALPSTPELKRKLSSATSTLE